jgi:hypothetical protein
MAARKVCSSQISVLRYVDFLNFFGAKMIKEVVSACVEEDIHHRYVIHLRNEKLQKTPLLASSCLPFSLFFYTNSRACGIIYYSDFALVSD